MIKVILEVLSDKDIAEKRWIAFELSAAEIQLEFVDVESKETVERLFFYDGDFTSFRR